MPKSRIEFTYAISVQVLIAVYETMKALDADDFFAPMIARSVCEELARRGNIVPDWEEHVHYRVLE